MGKFYQLQGGYIDEHVLNCFRYTDVQDGGQPSGLVDFVVHG
jgi:hypothetical protein